MIRKVKSLRKGTVSVITVSSWVEVSFDFSNLNCSAWIFTTGKMSICFPFNCRETIERYIEKRFKWITARFDNPNCENPFWTWNQNMNSFINDRLKFYTPQLKRKKNKNLRAANEDITLTKGSLLQLLEKHEFEKI